MITESTPALTQYLHTLPMKLTLITAIRATDLSTAFDTIKNVKLINILHMALKGTSLKCSDHSCPKVLNMYKPTRLIPNHLSHTRI